MRCNNYNSSADSLFDDVCGVLGPERSRLRIHNFLKESAGRSKGITLPIRREFHPIHLVASFSAE